MRIKQISNRAELDEFEHHNIQQAIEWLYGKKFSAEQVFSESVVCQIHERMFGEVWKWAGKFRQSNKNIGVDKWQISVALHSLNNDALYWVQHSSFDPIEIAIRYKHRLVSIHCFANGNGRHSRLMADIIMANVFKMQPLKWGMSSLTQSTQLRNNYIEALRSADAGDYSLLIAFAVS